MRYSPHSYQEFGTSKVIELPFCCLFLEMGLGKTVMALSAVNQLMYYDFEINKVLVVAPKRVVESVWPDEIEKWDHLQHLQYSLVIGSSTQRIAALKKKADIYIIGRDNAAWLVAFYGGSFPFDMLIIDELSSFKNPQSKRFKALRMIRPRLKRVIGMTGTPSGNGLIDLWSEMYLIDLGERLGKTLTSYRGNYFRPGQTNGAVVYNYRIQPQAEQQIFDKLKDICFSMKKKDYLQLPDKIENVVKVKLSPEVQSRYDDFEAVQVLQLTQSITLTALNAATLVGKLLQYANGAVYNGLQERTYSEVHNQKLDALDELVETTPYPMLVAYSFRHDYERIMKRFDFAELFTKNEQIKRWNDGEIRLLLCHPASAGHGLNLQYADGASITWFGLPWSLELYMQFNDRVHRQGRLKPVTVNKILAHHTMDFDVQRALTSKEKGQDALMEAVKALISKYKKFSSFEDYGTRI